MNFSSPQLARVSLGQSKTPNSQNQEKGGPPPSKPKSSIKPVLLLQQLPRSIKSPTTKVAAPSRILMVPVKTKKSFPKKTSSLVLKQTAKEEESKVRSHLHESIAESIDAYEQMHGKKTLPAVKEIVCSVCLPKDCRPVRIGTIFGSDPSALANPFVKFDAVWPPVGSIYPDGLDGTSCPVFAYRDPVRACIRLVGLGSTSTIYAGQTSIAMVPGQIAFPICPQSLGFVQGTDIHGPVLYPGRIAKSDPQRGFLVTQGTTISVLLVSALNTSGVNTNVRLFRLDGDQWVVEPNAGGVMTFSSVGTTNSFVVPIDSIHPSTYYTFRADNGSANNQYTFQVTLTMAAASSSTLAAAWGQLCLPDFEDVVGYVEAIRIPAVSCMYTNTSSDLNNQGQITGVQLAAGQSFLDNCVYSDLSQDRKSTTLNIKKGLYGPLKFKSPSDLDFFIPTTIEDDKLTGAFAPNNADTTFNIIPTSDYLVISASCGIAGGQEGYFTLAWGVEFTTQNQWQEVEISLINNKEYDDAIEIISIMPQWHENDFHVSDIMDFLGSAAKSVLKGLL